jgi:formylglycine-generating enzyme required for sulfatase activity
MRRWFLSYSSQDFALTQALKNALQRREADARIFFAPENMRAGGFWQQQLTDEIAESSAFVLLVGETGIGPWQVMEYYEALDRRAKEQSYPLILVLSAKRPAPGLPFVRQLHWVVTEDPTSEATIGKLIEAASGPATQPGGLWRHTRPYRGLEAMTEANSDFFFGREHETVEVINALASERGKLALLLGNSGVGKSSLAQAGVLTSLLRQRWPDHFEHAVPWPTAFDRSRHWCFVTLRPGTEPVRAIVEPFIRVWQFDATDPRREDRLRQWTDGLMSGRASLRGLLDATQDRLRELGQPHPPAFFLYIDQGEELYVRAEKEQRRRFSEIVATGLSDGRLRVLMSLRADFFGELQKDASLFGAHRQINVPPLREAALHRVVSQPAALLSARFQTDTLATDIARRTAEESAEDAGALPLLSYLLDDMWSEMVRRGDGVLRLPLQTIDLGRVLVERANKFIAERPAAEDALRRILTLKLATVRENGEPTRRRALHSELTHDEWRLVSELADHPYRLLVTATSDSGETYAEVAHEAIFRRWEKLRDWMASEREFLIWKSTLESIRRAYDNTPAGAKTGAVLMGLPLSQARDWLAKRAADIPPADRAYIVLSRNTALRRMVRARALVGVLALAVVAALAGWRYDQKVKEVSYWITDVNVLSTTAERALKPGSPIKECTSCPEMVVVPAGKFLMGSAKDERDRGDDEEPQHEVTLAQPFAVSKFEVTFEEWDACVDHGDCARNISPSGWGRGRQPVMNVSWDDAKRYVEWLSRITGKMYRLLSESEWEYVARAGTTSTYSFDGDESVLADFAWYELNSNDRPHPVGEKKPNAFGLYDIHGNVWEWVEDCWHDNYLNDPPTDGSAWITGGDCTRRVVRGGSWNYVPSALRSANRSADSPGVRSLNLGFRVARTLTP